MGSPRGESQGRPGRAATPLPLLCLTLLLLAAPTPASAFLDIKSILRDLGERAVDTLFKNQEVELLGHYCYLSRTPYVHSWKLKFKSTVHCPGWLPIFGKSRGHTNPAKSDRDATQNFVRQALSTGIIPEEEARVWL